MISMVEIAQGLDPDLLGRAITAWDVYSAFAVDAGQQRCKPLSEQTCLQYPRMSSPSRLYSASASATRRSACG
jgi:hypothetical protein